MKTTQTQSVWDIMNMLEGRKTDPNYKHPYHSRWFETQEDALKHAFNMMMFEKDRICKVYHKDTVPEPILKHLLKHGDFYDSQH